MKRIRRAVVIVAILLPVLGYMGVVWANDGIARSMEEKLLAYPLPPQTELVDSKAVAGKLTGNGNGMQYRGMLLVSSDLPEEELQAHYSSLNSVGCSVWVYPQKSQMIDEYYLDYWFDSWDNARPCWRIELYRDSVAGFEETVWESLLNIDLRGH